MTAHLSSIDSDYAKRRKQHLALINQLRAIGAQADLDLPRIVVLGNQSAGKSSLVEAISGITVPRDAGTCTRCPMECRLTSSTSGWHCQVSTRWEYNQAGSPMDEVREVPFGDLIKDPTCVEPALRRAQAAVLSPNQDAKKFILMSDEEMKNRSNELKFSKNVVCVDLYGPELTDLAFIDLPGIIQNAEPNIVRLVEDLARSHIKGNCLILVTVPMSDDIENQKAFQIAKQEDPSGLRTIGVMTKPDTLTSGATKSRDLWLDVIEGRRSPLRHGYYCTRQPDDEERAGGITSEQARQVERDFFAKTSPWSRTIQPHRFGTKNLITNLSKLLNQIIDDALPQLQGQVASHLSSCSVRLLALPPPITIEPSSHVLNLITKFCGDVHLSIQGDSQHADLVQRNRRTYSLFKRGIRSTAPQFIPHPNADEAPAHDSDDIHTFSDDEDTEDVASSGVVLYLEDVYRHIESSLTRELPQNVPYSAKTSLIRQTQVLWEANSRNCLDQVNRDLEKVMSQLIATQYQRHENLKSRVLRLVLELVRSKYEEAWKQTLHILQFESLPFTQNSHYLQQTKDKYLGMYKNARAEKASSGVPLTKLQKKPANTTQITTAGQSLFNFSGLSTSATTVKTPLDLNNLVQPSALSSNRFGIPTSCPSGSNGAVTANPPDSASSTITSSSAPLAPLPKSTVEPVEPATPTRRKTPTIDPCEKARLENEALSCLAKLGRTSLKAADFGKLVPPDVYEREMQVMAEVRAYFQVSYKRVIDYIPMSIDRIFLFSFSQDLQPFLIQKLGLGSENSAARCATYIAEDPHLVAEREELLSKKKRLENVQVELFNFGL